MIDSNGKEIIQGIDVSKWDWILKDWSATALRFPWAYIKSSEAHAADPIFKEQWAAAKGHVLRAAYHFFRPAFDPQRQAETMIKMMDGDIGEIFPVLDLEVTDGRQDTMARAEVFYREVHRLIGRYPIIYSRVSFMAENGAFKKTITGSWKHSWLVDARFIEARYPYDAIGDAARAAQIQRILDGEDHLKVPSVDATRPMRTRMWQWTSRAVPAQIPGYFLGGMVMKNGKLEYVEGKKSIDLNVYLGTLDDMKREFSIDQIPEPDPTPGVPPIVTPPPAGNEPRKAVKIIYDDGTEQDVR